MRREPLLVPAIFPRKIGECEQENLSWREIIQESSMDENRSRFLDKSLPIVAHGIFSSIIF